MNFLQDAQNLKKELLSDLTRFLQIDTTLIEQAHNKLAPFGEGLKEGLDFILNLGKSMGFKTKKIDEIVGYIEYGEGEEILAILCHIDVVPAGDGWTYPPFSATIVGDKLYARGAMDDKGPLMGSLYAMKIIKDRNIPLNKRVRLIVGTDEETDWRDIAAYKKHCEMPTLGFSPDAGFPLIYGEKGIMSVDLENVYHDEVILSLSAGDRYNVVPDQAQAVLQGNYFDEYKNYLEQYNLKGEVKLDHDKTIIVMYGKSAHAMNPLSGVNALVKLAQFLVTYSKNPLIQALAHNLDDPYLKKEGLDFYDQEMKNLTMNVALARINNSIGRIGLNFRYPINWDKEEFLVKFGHLNKDLNLSIKGDSKAHYVDKNSKLINLLHQAYIKYTGDDKTPITTIGGGTYARAFDNCVAFGMCMPNDEEVIHQVDEYLKISDLITSIAIYAEAIAKLGS